MTCRQVIRYKGLMLRLMLEMTHTRCSLCVCMVRWVFTRVDKSAYVISDGELSTYQE